MKKNLIFICIAALLSAVVLASCSDNVSPKNEGAFRIGNQNYRTLQEAVNAVAGAKDISSANTIVLTEDAEDEGASLDAEAEIAIDLKGHVLTAKGDKPLLELSDKVKGAEIKGGTIRAAKDKGSDAGLIKAACPLKVEDTKLDVSEAKEGASAIKASGAKADVQLKGGTKVTSTEKQNAVDVAGGAKLAIKDGKAEVSGGIKLDKDSEIKAENGKVEVLSYEGDGKIETSEEAKIEIPEGSDIDESAITEDIKPEEKPNSDGTIGGDDSPQNPGNPDKPQDPEEKPQDPENPGNPEESGNAEEQAIYNTIVTIVDRTIKAESRAMHTSMGLTFLFDDFETEDGIGIMDPMVDEVYQISADPYYDENAHYYSMDTTMSAVSCADGLNGGDAVEVFYENVYAMTEKGYEDCELATIIPEDTGDEIPLELDWHSDGTIDFYSGDELIGGYTAEDGYTVEPNTIGLTGDHLALAIESLNGIENAYYTTGPVSSTVSTKSSSCIDEMGLFLDDLTFCFDKDEPDGKWHLTQMSLNLALCSGAAQYNGHVIRFIGSFEGDIEVPEATAINYNSDHASMFNLIAGNEYGTFELTATIDGKPAHFSAEELVTMTGTWLGAAE